MDSEGDSRLISLIKPDMRSQLALTVLLVVFLFRGLAVAQTGEAGGKSADTHPVRPNQSGQSTPGIELDHVWIMVSAGAPERARLERAGFQISKDVNHHEGTGTSSITVEFENAYLELMWPDPKVPVAHEMERAAEKYRQRMLWRTSGWCPIGVGLRHTSPSNEPLPFPTWTWSADWMPKGSVMEMLTPRDDTRSPALFIEPRVLTNIDEQAARAAPYHHPIGVHRVTLTGLMAPRTYQPIAALTYLEKINLLTMRQGDEWAVELTFDGARQKRSEDFRPDLPLVIRY